MKIIRYERYADGSFKPEMVKSTSRYRLRDGRLCYDGNVELNTDKRECQNGNCGVYFEVLRQSGGHKL